MYKYVVEQVFFFIFFARALLQFTTNNLILHKLCVGDDPNHYLGKICPNERVAQQNTAVLNMYLFVTSNICFVFACTIGGYWTDLHKRRKPLLIIPLLGLLISAVVNIGLVYFWSIPGIVVAIFNGSMCLFGETNLLYAGGLIYVIDHTPESLRTFRVGILLGAYYVSTPIGRGLAGFMNVHLGFINCYLICIGFFIPSILIMIFCVSETKPGRYSKAGTYYANDDEKRKSIRQALEFYNAIHIAEMEQAMNDAVTPEKDSEHGVAPTALQTDVNIMRTVQISDTSYTSEHIMIETIEYHTKQNSAIQSNQVKSLSEESSTDIIGSKESNENASSNQNEESVHHGDSQSNSNCVVFDNRGFEEDKWKQVPKPKKAKSKDPLYYHAYVEGKRPPMEGHNPQTKSKSLIVMSFLSLYESFKVLFRTRPENKTARLVVMVLTSSFYVAPMIVENSVFPLFVRHKFQWTEPMYGTFAGFKLSIVVVGICFSIGLLNKVMKVPDTVVGVIASIGDTAACLGYVFVTESWQMFLVPILDIFHGSAQICDTSVISKLIDEDERGKIMAIKYALDSLFPVVLYPIYNFIYKNTLTYFPEAFFLVSAACAIPGIFAFSYVHYLSQQTGSKLVTTKM